MANIGEPVKEYEAWPVEVPVPRREPKQEPRREPVRVGGDGR